MGCLPFSQSSCLLIRVPSVMVKEAAYISRRWRVDSHSLAQQHWVLNDLAFFFLFFFLLMVHTVFL
jgi:hypothetical protein